MLFQLAHFRLLPGFSPAGLFFIVSKAGRGSGKGKKPLFGRADPKG